MTLAAALTSRGLKTALTHVAVAVAATPLLVLSAHAQETGLAGLIPAAGTAASGRIVQFVMLLTVLSTVYPALRAARTPPADALRYE